MSKYRNKTAKITKFHIQDECLEIKFDHDYLAKFPHDHVEIRLLYDEERSKMCLNMIEQDLCKTSSS